MSVLAIMIALSLPAGGRGRVTKRQEADGVTWAGIRQLGLLGTSGE